MYRLTIKARDEQNRPICVKVILRSADGRTLVVDYIEGDKTFELAEARVDAQIRLGRLFIPIQSTLTLSDRETVVLTAVMKRLFEPKKYNMYAFDAHNHVSRKHYDKTATIDLEKAVVIAKGADLDGFFAGVPYDYENHKEAKTGVIRDNRSYRERYSDFLWRVNDASFTVDLGNEFCKYRYGHVFMLNYEQRPPVDRYRDPLYYPYEQRKPEERGVEPPFDNLPISNAILDAKEPGSAAVFAHPTSWWYENNGQCFVTNIAAALGFDVLTGAIDAMAIMGYKADQPYYRRLWYELLNQGYRMTGVAETDAIMDDENFSMPPFRTYAYLDELSADGFARAVQAGRCMATSGPILHFTVDGHLSGDRLEHTTGQVFKISAVMHACCEAPLERLEIICNGKTVREETLCGQPTAKVIFDMPAPEVDGYVLALCFDKAGNLAISNPIYIRNEPFVNDCFRSQVSVEVYRGSLPATGSFRVGHNEETHFDSKVQCTIKPHEPIHIRVGDTERTVELFGLKSLQEIFKNLYTGSFNSRGEYQPGEVPIQAFQIQRIRDILTSVHIRVDLPDDTGSGVVRFQNTHVKSDWVSENRYIGMKYHELTVPEWHDFKKTLPIPRWTGHDSVIRCYHRAWEIAHGKLKQPIRESGFVANFLYTEFSNSIFMWGLSFVSQFGRYARRGFDFIGCLDNFYAKQHSDGFICRQINIFTGNDEFERFDPSSTGPNILAWAEWEDYLISGDRDRLQRVFSALTAYHRWMRNYRTWQDGSYFSSGWGCGMDNQPRMQSGYHPEFDHGHMTWIDITAQQVLSAKTILRIAQEIGREDEVADMAAEVMSLSAYINQHLWDEQESFYFDRYRDGSLATEKTIGAYWTLLAGIVPDERLEEFVAHLEVGGCFDAPHRVPSLPPASSHFVKNGGDYWRGGVWCITNYMVIKGLLRRGHAKTAHEIARNHVENITGVFEQTGTIWESYDALKPLPGKCHGKFVRNEFVGFSGLGPITMLLENVLGFNAQVTEGTLIWRMFLTDAHGVDRYPFGSEGIVNVSCASRKSQQEEPKIIANANIDLTIKVLWIGGEKTIFIKAGETYED